jgi:type I restriction enzyme M protein
MSNQIITIPEGKVYDFIDGTFRNDTPEEYVRQNISKRLVNELRYPRDRIAVEFSLRLGSRKPRADIVIFLKDKPATQENVTIIVECKKESTSPNDRQNGIGQLQSYMSACLNCEWGLWTNGKERQVFRRVKKDDGTEEFVEFNDIPSVSGSVEDVERPSRQNLVRAAGDALLFAFKASHNHIHVTDGLQKEAAFFELLKIIFCKIEDERNIPKPLEFYVRSTERKNADGQLACKNRINTIFGRVKTKYGKIFATNETIELKPSSLSKIVGELQGYSFLNTNIDIKGKAYEEIVGANLKGDRGQFFTPRNMMHMAVSMLNPTSEEKVLDPACGTGGFLVTAMSHVMEDLTRYWEKDTGNKEKNWSEDERRVFSSRISEIAQSNYFGFDIAPSLVRATKMNMVMNNDGSGNILQADSLLPPHKWEKDFKEALAKNLQIDVATLTSHRHLEYFDIIVTNPPFGSKIVIKDDDILEQYDLGHVWTKPKVRSAPWVKTDRLQSGVPPEQLFIERCLQFLKPGGRLAVVLPDSILGSPGLSYIRQWLISQVYIVASADLHPDTFQPHTGVQTSILILQKKTAEEKAAEQETGFMRPHNTFMAMVEKVGHDKRGNTIYERDEDGGEILVPVEAEDEDTLKERMEKVINDQSRHVPEAFKQWKKNEGIVW